MSPVSSSLPQTAIIGDGQMALVMADALAARGAAVRLSSFFPADLEQLAVTRASPRLPGFRLDPAVEVCADPALALRGSGAVISAIPTQFLRNTWKDLGRGLGEDVSIFSVTKGIENGTMLRPSQVILESLGDHRRRVRGVCVLSGPAIAAELAQRLPCTMVAACDAAEVSQLAQDLFNVRWLRIYRSDDVIGVEVAGAAKNVIALAAGMVDGLKAGANAKSALLARGLAEIARLGAAMGAQVETFFGVAGVGDLATSCFSPEGRNRSCGERLARGESLDSILASSSSVVEGVPTTQSLIELSKQHRIEMPIAAAVHSILFEGLSPRRAIENLMGRAATVEKIR